MNGVECWQISHNIIFTYPWYSGAQNYYQPDRANLRRVTSSKILVLPWHIILAFMIIFPNVSNAIGQIDTFNPSIYLSICTNPSSAPFWSKDLSFSHRTLFSKIDQIEVPNTVQIRLLTLVGCKLMYDLGTSIDLGNPIRNGTGLIQDKNLLSHGPFYNRKRLNCLYWTNRKARIIE